MIIGRFGNRVQGTLDSFLGVCHPHYMFGV
jgi:hypothetical protein